MIGLVAGERISSQGAVLMRTLLRAPRRLGSPPDSSRVQMVEMVCCWSETLLLTIRSGGRRQLFRCQKQPVKT